MKYVVVVAFPAFLAIPTLTTAAEFTAEVQLRGQTAGALLKRLDISVDSIRQGVARVWVNDAEANELQAAGLTVRRVVDEAFLETNKDGLAAGYHTPETCVDDFRAWAQANPEICVLSEIGTSVQNRPILALKMTTDPTAHGFKPLVRICGAHHGNEVASSEVVIMFAKYLLDNYRTDARLAKILAERELWCIPMVNPDGVAKRTRYNANYVDLNRNYGYRFSSGYKAGKTAFSEPESRAIRDQASNLPFSLSLSFHTSGDIVNYLWNYTSVRCPDQDLIFELSQGYARFNGYDVTEGCDWYQVNGDTNDWSYGCMGDIDWTIEIANPSFSGMPGVFEKNREAMLYICEQAGRGVCGTVTDGTTGKPLRAMVEAIPPGWPAFTHPEGGDYHRVLQPGTYKLRVWAPGYQEKVIDAVEVGAADATRVDVTLDAAPGRFNGLHVVALTVPEDQHKNTTHGPHALGPADGRFCSLGSNGFMVLDLSPDFPAGASAKLTVHDAPDADGNAEPFELATATSPDGPWTAAGSGSGTATVPVQGLQRYVKVTAKGTTAKATETITPGLDLDALTVELRPATQARQFGVLHDAR